MPDYNPAVAAGIQVPQSNWAGTLGTVANIQAEQARTNLYTLQAMQQQRQYSGLMAAARAAGEGGDPVKAAAPYGLDPASLNQFQALQQSQTFAGQHGGLSPQGAEANASIAKTGLETTSLQKEDAAQAAQSYFASGDRSPIIAHAQKYHDVTDPRGGGAMGISLLANLPKDQFDRVAASALGAKVPAKDLTEIFRAGDTDINDYNNPNLSMAQRVGAAPALRQPGEVTQAKAEADATVKYLQEDGNKRYTNAQALKASMVNINHDIETLGPAWMGWGAETKAEALKGVNSVLGQFGVAPIAPEKSASAEDFVKETIRAGMQLINSNFGGSREAASIVQMGKTANASINNSYLGAKYVASTIGAMAQRESDLYEYQAAHKNQLPAVSAIQFNKQNPPEDYAMRGITNVIPDEAKKTLLSKKDTPGEKASFDKTFGPGTAEFLTR